MKKILVTGAAGFIGYFTMKRLIDEGFTVIGIDNVNDYYDINLKYARLNELGFERPAAEIWNKEVRSTFSNESFFIRMNIEDKDCLPQLFAHYQFDAVIHLAAQAGVRYSLENPLAYIDSNIVGFMNILECCRNNNIKHLVYASSSSVYGESPKIPFSEEDRVDFPVSLYAATKKANELMAHTYSHLYQLSTSGLRFFTVYGPYGRPDMAPMLFTSAITENKPIKVFNNGNMSRDFTYIDDIVNGIIITLKNPPRKDFKQPYYQLFNIGKGAPISLIDFIETLEKELGKKSNKRMLPMQAGDVPRTWADTSQLKVLGYQSITSIELGVRQFVQWYKEYYK